MKVLGLFKINFENIKKDIKQFWVAILAAFVYFMIMHLTIGAVCPARNLFGIPCPGCGMTRAFLLVLQGKVRAATHMNMFWFPVYIIAVWGFFTRYLIADQETSEKMLKIIKKCVIVIVILSIIYYAYRMIILYPNEQPIVYHPDNFLNAIRQQIK